MTVSDKPLNERINDALSAKDPWACRGLVEEAEAASSASNEEYERLRAHALNPTLSDDDVAKARREMDDALFSRDRWQKAAETIRESVERFHRENAEREAVERYDESRRRMEDAAQVLSTEYLGLANRLGAILGEMAEANRRMRRANAGLKALKPIGTPVVGEMYRDVVAAARLPALRAGKPIFGMSKGAVPALEFHPEVTNAEKVHLTPKPRPGPARSPDAVASPVGNSIEEEAA